MKNIKNIIATFALGAVFTISTSAVPAYGADTVAGGNHQLYTISGFIDLLISKGIISDAKAEHARKLASMVEQTDGAQTKDDVEVTVSQYIEHGDLTYIRFENITGLLLTVKNTSDKILTMHAKRNCQVVYRIYNAKGERVYDSAESKACQTSEKVTYILEAGKTRIFPITHKLSDYALSAGTYTFEIEYPEYGKGERTITVE